MNLYDIEQDVKGVKEEAREEAKRRVEAGFSWIKDNLGQKGLDRIDLEILNVASPSYCPLALASGLENYIVACNKYHLYNLSDRVKLGFTSGILIELSLQVTDEMLTTAWKEALTKDRGLA